MLVAVPLFLLPSAAPQENVRAPARPTALVVISLDTCRADRLSCYGGPRPTPRIDGLAEQSVRFLDCLSQSCVTAPSHMSLFTGQYVHRHGLLENGDAATPSTTLASVLRENGFRTAAFTGHGLLRAGFGHEVGFEVFQSGERTLKPGTYWRRLGEAVPEALAWLDGIGDERFFLFVHGYDPHQPYWPPQPWRRRYAGWYRGDLEPLRTRPEDYARLIAEGEFGPDEKRYVSDLYDGEVATADGAVGALLDGLAARGLLERSLVLFLSDHGESLGGGGAVGHLGLAECVLHVPLLVRFPGGRHAGPCDEPVQVVDLLPTVLDALGVPVPPGVQGRDLLPSIEEGTPLPSRMRLAEVGARFAVRFGDGLKLLGRLEDGQVLSRRLYRVREDPGEKRNLLTELEGRRAYAARLTRYRAWREATAAGDREHGADASSLRAEERDLLRALGYAGED